MTIVPDIGIMIATLIALFFLLITLNKILYKPLLTFMDNREEAIKRDLENASKNTDDISSYQEEANRIILEAKNKALKIRMDILSEAKAVNDKKVADKKAELEAEYEGFIKNINSDKDKLKAALSSQMSSFHDVIDKKLNQL